MQGIEDPRHHYGSEKVSWSFFKKYDGTQNRVKRVNTQKVV